MTKLDVEVGEDFPLNEGRPHGQRRHHHAFHRAHEHRFHRHARHHHRGGARLALLLILGGLTALIVEHRLTPGIAYGMIGLGAALLVLGAVARGIFHWRFHRALRAQAG